MKDTVAEERQEGERPAELLAHCAEETWVSAPAFH
jgi:hypothetical protein